MQWKFNNCYGHSSIFEELIPIVIEGIASDNLPDIVVPVPLHMGRLRKRGFNQSRILAAKIASVTGAELSDKALIRIKKTIPQTNLSREERIKNIKKAFLADRTRVSGKKVMVVDDIYTTGATIRECAVTLQRAGAEMIEAVTLARTLI